MTRLEFIDSFITKSRAVAPMGTTCTQEEVEAVAWLLETYCELVAAVQAIPRIEADIRYEVREAAIAEAPAGDAA